MNDSSMSNRLNESYRASGVSFRPDLIDPFQDTLDEIEHDWKEFKEAYGDIDQEPLWHDDGGVYDGNGISFRLDEPNEAYPGTYPADPF